MYRFSVLKSILALVVALPLAMGSVFPVLAQTDESASEEATAPPDTGTEPAYGLLQISAVTCTGSEPGTVSILLAAEFASSGDCVDGSATLLIDGVDHGPAAPYLEVPIEAGVHSLFDPNSGTTRDVEVPVGGATAVIVVAFTAAPEEPARQPTVAAAATTATTGLTVVAHACEPDIQSVDGLYTLGGLTDRLNACPAMTLSGYPGPAGAIDGGEYWFDFTLAPETGEPQSLTGNGSFAPDAFCESTAGPLDNDPTNDRCVNNSGFTFQLPQGPITLTQTVIPDTLRYVAAETGSDADAAVITGSDPTSGYLGLDTSLVSTGQPVIHLFYLRPPRVNVIVHLCSADIASRDALAGLGSLAAQLLACPASARTGEGGWADFGVTVTDNNWGARTLDSATFDPAIICESDIGDWNGDGSDNACLDAPTYRFDRTAMGYVAVAQDFAPEGYVFGGANSDSGAITSIDPAAALVTLDTSFDGDVTIHLFDIVAAPQSTETPAPLPTNSPSPVPTKTNTPVPPTTTRTPTAAPATRTPAAPTATRTPVSTATGTAVLPTATPAPLTPTESTGSTDGTGTVTVAALYCLSGSGTTVIALAPGQPASASDMGGGSCFAGDATVQITLFGTETVPSLKLGRDGVESIQGIPATSAARGSHTVTEQLTGQHAAFEITPGVVTRILIRYGAGTSMIDEGVSSTGGTAGKPGGSTTSPSGGLVTDELIPDEGAGFPGSYDGISYTSLIAGDVDAQAVSSVKDARSLPGVGIGPLRPMQRDSILFAAFGLALALVAFAARRSLRRSG